MSGLGVDFVEPCVEWGSIWLSFAWLHKRCFFLHCAGGREKSGVVSGRVEMFVRPFKSIAERRQAQAGQQVRTSEDVLSRVIAQATAEFCETVLAAAVASC